MNFDAAALGPAILAAGAGLWDSNRPFTLVAISPVPSGPAGDALRVALEQAAEARGLPISLVPLAVSDATGVPLADEGVLQGAQALGGDAVLIGRARCGEPRAMAVAPGEWLHLRGLDRGLGGRHQRCGRFARQCGDQHRVKSTGAGRGAGRRCRLVDRLRTRGATAQGRAGSTVLGLTAAQGTTAIFNVGVRGGGEALVHALAGSSHLGTAVTGGETRLQLNYRP